MTVARRAFTTQIPESANSLRSVAQILPRAVRHYNPHAGITYLAPGVGGAPEFASFQTPRQLAGLALDVLAGLRARGLRPGAKVAVLLEDHRDTIIALWACLLGGYVACPMVAQHTDPIRWAASLTHVQELLEGPLLVASSELIGEIRVVPGLEITTLDNLRGTGSDSGEIYLAEPDDPALLMLTSGSTGAAKAVILTHANLLAALAGKQQIQRLGRADIAFNWISFDHVAALLETHLFPLYAGAQQIHAPAELILSDPPNFLRILARYRVTMTFTPNFLLGQLNSWHAAEPARERLDLSALRHIVSGGEANVVATGRAFLDAFAADGLRPGALWPAFGMTETCAGSIYNQEFPIADADFEFAAAGRPVTGLRMRISDETGSEQVEGQVGELQLHGPMITPGYYRNPAATADAFTDDGWFRTGDVGRVEQGRLRLVGRSKDTIIVNGVNYFSHEIETALEELDGVLRGHVAAFPTRSAGSDTEQLVIVFVPSSPYAGPVPDQAALFRTINAIRSTVVDSGPVSSCRCAKPRSPRPAWARHCARVCGRGWSPADSIP